MKESMNTSKQMGSKEKLANTVGRIAQGVAEASSDKCLFIFIHESKMPKSLIKRD